jgi:hypothetical protein
MQAGRQDFQKKSAIPDLNQANVDFDESNSNRELAVGRFFL